ncbi:MAG: 30S ribosome-binding factor RbfA [Bacteroidales bacterium]|jgi:ribosome-binding factor A|nr:30S ribosome-binding factor RbfA [Bacteroidales bacterium]
MQEENTRQKKVCRLLQKELSDLFLLQAKQMQGTLITVSSVRISPDLALAKLYLSIFPSEKAETLLETIKANTRQIRHDLGIRIRHQLRIVPELAFFIDDSLDYIEKIDHLLKQ